MKINDYFAGSVFIKILNDELENESGELNLVLAEYIGERGSQRTDFNGLDIALSIDPQTAPIIFTSFMPVEYFLKDKDFQIKFNALMAKKRVGFLRLPFTADELIKKYKTLINDEKEEDLLAIELNEIATYNKRMGEIQHRVKYRLDNSEEVAWGITEVRKLNVSGTDEEVIELIKNFERQHKFTFNGKYFPGIFCDIENTLMINDQLNQKMLEILRECSSTKPITLWTGGEMGSIQKLLLRNNITWKLVSKNDFAGAEVETAYDDEEFSVFFEKYEVKVREFIQI